MGEVFESIKHFRSFRGKQCYKWILFLDVIKQQQRNVTCLHTARVVSSKCLQASSSNASRRSDDRRKSMMQDVKQHCTLIWCDGIFWCDLLWPEYSYKSIGMSVTYVQNNSLTMFSCSVLRKFSPDIFTTTNIKHQSQSRAANRVVC